MNINFSIMDINNHKTPLHRSNYTSAYVIVENLKKICLNRQPVEILHSKTIRNFK